MALLTNDKLTIFVVAILAVLLSEYFYIIPAIVFFISLLILVVIGLYSIRPFIFLSAITVVMTFMPQTIQALLKQCFDNTYTYVYSTSCLVAIVSYIGGVCFVRENKVSPKFLLSVTGILIVAIFLFKDFLIYEKVTLATNLFIIAVIFVLIGSKSVALRYVSSKAPFLHIVILVLFFCLTFIVTNFIMINHVTKVAWIECFSQWADTSEGYTLDDMTMKSSYSYSLMNEMLANKYRLISINDRKELDSKLKDAQVAIIITPTIPLNDSEIRQLKEFVSHGGRLLVITDHTDLYGHGRVVNLFLPELGARAEYNALFEIGTPKDEIYLPNMPIRLLKIKTPNSFVLLKPGYIFGWAKDWISESADYTGQNFFGELKWTTDDQRGTWPVGGIFKYGKGDIVVWGDSTIFANFAIFQPNILRFLGCLVEGGGLLASLSKYGLFAILLLLLTLSGNVFWGPKSMLIVSSVLVFLSGCYYIWDHNPETFYLRGKKIIVYCDKKLLYEPLPKNIPEKNNMSSAYSHIARSGIRPLYKGSKPLSRVSEKSIWMTDYDSALKLDSQISKSLWGIVIVDDKDMTKIGFNKLFLKNDIHNIFNDFFNKEIVKKGYYLTKDNNHSLVYNGVSIVSANGILTDIDIGDWWITTDVSPFRRHMLREWASWVNKKTDISVFVYPPIGVKELGFDWKIKYENRDYKTIKMTVIPYEINNKKYVYIGSGIWALYERDGEQQFLVGGPELSDNYLKSGVEKWAAETVNNGKGN